MIRVRELLKKKEKVNMNKKKKDNRGFSLIELIIAIAILVILTGLLAPQFMKYMEKSREAKDMQSLDTLYGAVQTALADEKAYDDVKNQIKTGGNLVGLDKTGLDLETIISKSKEMTTGTTPTAKSPFCKEVVATLGTADSSNLWSSKAVVTANSTGVSDKVFVLVSEDLGVTVWIGKAATGGKVKPATDALNPDTAVVEGCKTAGTTFYISR